MVFIGFQYFWNFLHFFNSEEGTGAHVITSFVSCAVVQSAPGLYFVADFKNSQVQSCKHLALQKLCIKVKD